MIISNNHFSDDEKHLLDFILRQDFLEKEETIHFINALNSTDIVRDYSPFYKIIEFRVAETKDGYLGMSPMICVQVLHHDGDAPTVFTLYSKDGLPFEFEIYNADSSEMDMTKICCGDIHITV